MTDLTVTTPAAGLLPLTVGGLALTEGDPGPMTLLMPYRGRTKALDSALMAAHGIGLPDPNAMTRAGKVTCLFFGLDSYLLCGVAADAGLVQHAALVDQSDGWTVLHLTGATVPDVLARLVPLDLRDAGFPVGAVVRTLVGHMNASISRPQGDSWQIMVFRSMAKTLLHEVETAAEQVAARPRG